MYFKEFLIYYNLLYVQQIFYVVGGDEFIILCGGFETEEDATDFVQRLKRNINDAKKHEIAWTSISVGKTSIKEGEYLEEIMARADNSLYDEKRNKKKS